MERAIKEARASSTQLTRQEVAQYVTGTIEAVAVAREILAGRPEDLDRALAEAKKDHRSPATTGHAALHATPSAASS